MNQQHRDRNDRSQFPGLSSATNLHAGIIVSSLPDSALAPLRADISTLRVMQQLRTEAASFPLPKIRAMIGFVNGDKNGPGAMVRFDVQKLGFPPNDPALAGFTCVYKLGVYCSAYDPSISEGASLKLVGYQPLAKVSKFDKAAFQAAVAVRLEHEKLGEGDQSYPNRKEVNLFLPPGHSIQIPRSVIDLNRFKEVKIGTYDEGQITPNFFMAPVHSLSPLSLKLAGKNINYFKGVLIERGKHRFKSKDGGSYELESSRKSVVFTNVGTTPLVIELPERLRLRSGKRFVYQ